MELPSCCGKGKTSATNATEAEVLAVSRGDMSQSKAIARKSRRPAICGVIQVRIISRTNI